MPSAPLGLGAGSSSPAATTHPSEESFLNEQARRRGKRAREDAQARAGSGRISAEAWYPSLLWLRELGYKVYEIAELVSLDESRVREVFRVVSSDGSASVTLSRPPVAREALDAETLASLELSGVGFKLFYERFSENSLPLHCETWVQEFCDHRNLMLNVPPRHMKSTIFSLWVPIWLLARDRDEQIIIVSKASDLATIWCYAIADQLENNQALVEVFGRFAPQRKGETIWSPGTGKLLVLGRHTLRRGTQFSVLSRGSGQHILGREATVVIADDPTSASRARSETERVNELQWFREEVLSRIENPSVGGAAGRAVIIGQRVHHRDLYGSIAAQAYERGPRRGEPLWTVISHPAVSVWPDEAPDGVPEVLWPEKWPFEELMVQYERMGGHHAFSCLFQQQPLPDDSRTFLPGWLEDCRDPRRPGGVGVRDTLASTSPSATTRRALPGQLDPSRFSRVISLDPSPTRRNGLAVVDVLWSQRAEDFYCVVLEARSFVAKMLAVTRVVDELIARYQPDYFVMEESAVTKWAMDDPWWQRIDQRIRKIPHQTGRNKNDPIIGIDAMGGDFELGRVRLPYGDDLGRATTKLIEDEALAWGYGDHDDVMHSLWFVKINRMRFVPTSGFSGSAGNFWNAPRRLIAGFPRRPRRYAVPQSPVKVGG